MKRTGKECAEVVAKTIREIYIECGNDESRLNRDIIKSVSEKNNISYSHINDVGNFDRILRDVEMNKY